MVGAKTQNKKELNIFKNSKYGTLIYPVFIECSKYFTDEFWKNLFEEMSYGKCPKSFYISNNTIYASNKRKQFSYVISEDKSPETMATDIRNLLLQHTNLCSLQDTKDRHDELLLRTENVVTEETTWSSIRKKNIREIYLVRFVLRMKDKYNLSWDWTRHLYSIIQLGFIFKTQSSKDVIFKSKRIENINGIVYDESKKHFVNEFCNNDFPKDKDEDQSNDNYLFYYWDKYVVAVSKKY